jgi:predicted amidohydrolase YtcJ
VKSVRGKIELESETVIRALRIFSLCIFLLSGAAAHAQVSADTVLLHGKVWTENPAQPEAEAVAVLGDKVIAVGTSEQISKLAGPRTRVIELHGRRVLPGFNDAHVHLFDGGMSLTSVQLRDASSPEEMRQRIKEYAGKLPPGEWIEEGEWDHERWSPADLPTHQLIDDVTPNNPVFLDRLDGHMALANALAMKLAGVDRATKNVPGGEIVRDKDGNPTGIFKDAAKSLIERVVPATTKLQTERALDAAQRYAASNGVTSVQNMWEGEPPEELRMQLQVVQQAMHEDRLQLRISIHQGLPYWHLQADAGIQADFGSTMLHIGGLKAFADGSLGSHTAWMLAPYADATPAMEYPNGLASHELLHPDEMYGQIRDADKAGLQIAIHAIGDRANREILNFYERAEKENGPRDRRFRIEHAQHLSPQDIPRFAQLHVIASMQPYHMADDGRWAENRIGPERIKQAYVFRSLLDSGAVLAFGSDWPVAPMTPLEGIWAAVTRQTLDGKNPNGWVPEQKISVTQAVHGYTMGSAFAEFEENIKGSIERGKLADLVVVDTDIFHADADQLRKARVDLTMLGGKVIFARP